MKKPRTLLLTFLLALPLLVSTGSIQARDQVPTAELSLMGINGQQVKFTCSGLIDTVYYDGTNEYGYNVQWSGEAQHNFTQDYVLPGGWWWKGDLEITYRTTSHGYTSKIFDVPQFHYVDIWHAYC